MALLECGPILSESVGKVATCEIAVSLLTVSLTVWPVFACLENGSCCGPTQQKMAPKAGLEPATRRLTADSSTIELLWNPNPNRAKQPSGGCWGPKAPESTNACPTCQQSYRRYSGSQQRRNCRELSTLKRGRSLVGKDRSWLKADFRRKISAIELSDF